MCVIHPIHCSHVSLHFRLHFTTSNNKGTGSWGNLQLQVLLIVVHHPILNKYCHSSTFSMSMLRHSIQSTVRISYAKNRNNSDCASLWTCWEWLKMPMFTKYLQLFAPYLSCSSHHLKAHLDTIDGWKASPISTFWTTFYNHKHDQYNHKHELFGAGAFHVLVSLLLHVTTLENLDWLIEACRHSEGDQS